MPNPNNDTFFSAYDESELKQELNYEKVIQARRSHIQKISIKWLDNFSSKASPENDYAKIILLNRAKTFLLLQAMLLSHPDVPYFDYHHNLEQRSALSSTKPYQRLKNFVASRDKSFIDKLDLIVGKIKLSVLSQHDLKAIYNLWHQLVPNIWTTDTAEIHNAWREAIDDIHTLTFVIKHNIHLELGLSDSELMAIIKDKSIIADMNELILAIASQSDLPFKLRLVSIIKESILPTIKNGYHFFNLLDSTFEIDQRIAVIGVFKDVLPDIVDTHHKFFELLKRLPKEHWQIVIDYLKPTFALLFAQPENVIQFINNSHREISGQSIHDNELSMQMLNIVLDATTVTKDAMHHNDIARLEILSGLCATYQHNLISAFIHSNTLSRLVHNVNDLINFLKILKKPEDKMYVLASFSTRLIEIFHDERQASDTTISSINTSVCRLLASLTEAERPAYIRHVVSLLGSTPVNVPFSSSSPDVVGSSMSSDHDVAQKLLPLFKDVNEFENIFNLLPNAYKVEFFNSTPAISSIIFQQAQTRTHTFFEFLTHFNESEKKAVLSIVWSYFIALLNEDMPNDLEAIVAALPWHIATNKISAFKLNEFARTIADNYSNESTRRAFVFNIEVVSLFRDILYVMVKSYDKLYQLLEKLPKTYWLTLFGYVRYELNSIFLNPKTMIQFIENPPKEQSELTLPDQTAASPYSFMLGVSTKGENVIRDYAYLYAVLSALSTTDQHRLITSLYHHDRLSLYIDNIDELTNLLRIIGDPEAKLSVIKGLGARFIEMLHDKRSIDNKKSPSINTKFSLLLASMHEDERPALVRHMLALLGQLNDNMSMSSSSSSSTVSSSMSSDSESDTFFDASLDASPGMVSENSLLLLFANPSEFKHILNLMPTFFNMDFFRITSHVLARIFQMDGTRLVSFVQFLKPFTDSEKRLIVSCFGFSRFSKLLSTSKPTDFASIVKMLPWDMFADMVNAFEHDRLINLIAGEDPMGTQSSSRSPRLFKSTHERNPAFINGLVEILNILPKQCRLDFLNLPTIHVMITNIFNEYVKFTSPYVHDSANNVLAKILSTLVHDDKNRFLFHIHEHSIGISNELKYDMVTKYRSSIQMGDDVLTSMIVKKIRDAEPLGSKLFNSISTLFGSEEPVVVTNTDHIRLVSVLNKHPVIMLTQLFEQFLQKLTTDKESLSENDPAHIALTQEMELVNDSIHRLLTQEKSVTLDACLKTVNLRICAKTIICAGRDTSVWQFAGFMHAIERRIATHTAEYQLAPHAAMVVDTATASPVLIRR